MMQGGELLPDSKAYFLQKMTQRIFLLPRKGSKVYSLLKINEKNIAASKL